MRTFYMLMSFLPLVACAQLSPKTNQMIRSDVVLCPGGEMILVKPGSQTSGFVITQALIDSTYAMDVYQNFEVTCENVWEIQFDELIEHLKKDQKKFFELAKKYKVQIKFDSFYSTQRMG